MNKKWIVGLMVAGCAVGAGAANVELSPQTTQTIGRGQVDWQADSVQVKDATVLMNEPALSDFTFSFEGRAPEGAEADAVGIWASFRQFDRNFLCYIQNRP